ncbi:MAG TPA: TlpA family protein disulfide reductase [Candidatus Marinimicrobia bacterium]|nr:TlpA family protein disulfide reductase [Candidatus Neomarinimicrobiota bacterium]
MRLKHKILKLILVGVLGAIGFFLLFSQEIKFSLSQKEALNKVLGDINKAPDFTLTAMNDSIYTLSKLEGKVVLINFWATWCGPCRMEIPEFNEMHKSYHERGLEILGISVSDNKKQLKNFAKSFAVNYPLLYGGAREMNKIMKDYGGVYAVPSSFLVGKNGNIVWSYPGAILKNYDPQTFATLLYEIEKELKKGEIENPVEE